MQQTQHGYDMQIESEHTMHVVLISACLSVQVDPAVRRVSAALSSALPRHTCMHAIGSAPLGTSFLRRCYIIVPEVLFNYGSCHLPSYLS
jgi:hypothetical protein